MDDSLLSASSSFPGHHHLRQPNQTANTSNTFRPYSASPPPSQQGDQSRFQSQYDESRYDGEEGDEDGSAVGEEEAAGGEEREDDEELDDEAFARKIDEEVLGLNRPTEWEVKRSRDVLVDREGDVEEEGTSFNPAPWSLSPMRRRTVQSRCWPDYLVIIVTTELLRLSRKKLAQALRSLEGDAWMYDEKGEKGGSEQFVPAFRLDMAAGRGSEETGSQGAGGGRGMEL
jgi:hypothetical protein